jgi:hypothetical protein
MHLGHMESLNWVASCVDELDDTLSRFTGVQWDSVRAIWELLKWILVNKTLLEGVPSQLVPEQA